MATINFVECVIDMSESDIKDPQAAANVLMSHYSEIMIHDESRDSDGNATVKGRHICITGMHGDYRVTELPTT